MAGFWKLILSSLFFEEKYLWKLICLCCTGLLLVQIFLNFFFVKPTVTSVERTNLSKINFPDIIVCFEDGFDKEKLDYYGYPDSYRYFLGQSKDNFIGWSGIENEDSFRK